MRNFNVVISWFVKIYQEFLNRKLDFDLTFGRYIDPFRKSDLKTDDFEHVILNILKLKKDYNFTQIVSYL